MQLYSNYDYGKQAYKSSYLDYPRNSRTSSFSHSQLDISKPTHLSNVGIYSCLSSSQALTNHYQHYAYNLQSTNDSTTENPFLIKTPYRCPITNYYDIDKKIGLTSWQKQKYLSKNILENSNDILQYDEMENMNYEQESIIKDFLENENQGMLTHHTYDLSSKYRNNPDFRQNQRRENINKYANPYQQVPNRTDLYSNECQKKNKSMLNSRKGQQKVEKLTSVNKSQASYVQQKSQKPKFKDSQIKRYQFDEGMARHDHQCDNISHQWKKPHMNQDHLNSIYQFNSASIPPCLTYKHKVFQLININ